MDPTTSIITTILNHPVTNYVLGFGGISVVTAFGVKRAQALLRLSETALGRITLGAGALGGVLVQGSGLVHVPGGAGWGYALAAFCGTAATAIGASFTSLDLTHSFKSTPPSQP